MLILATEGQKGKWWGAGVLEECIWPLPPLGAFFQSQESNLSLPFLATSSILTDTTAHNFWVAELPAGIVFTQFLCHLNWECGQPWIMRGWRIWHRKTWLSWMRCVQVYLAPESRKISLGRWSAITASDSLIPLFPPQGQAFMLRALHSSERHGAGLLRWCSFLCSLTVFVLHLFWPDEPHS